MTQLRALAEYLLQNRIRAGLIGGALLAGALLFPLLQLPLLPLSGVPAALIAMRQGGLQSVQTLLSGLFCAVLLLLLFGVALSSAASLALFFWLPVWGCALVLRRSESQGMMVTACAGAAVLLIFSLHLWAGDPSVHWRQQLEQLAESQGSSLAPSTIEQLSRWIVGAAGVFFMCLLIGTVWLARWLQASHCMPGGFARELRNLYLPRPLLVAPVLVLLWPSAASQMGAWFLRDLGLLWVALYTLAGVASLVRRGVPGGWLALAALLLLLSGRYALLLLVPLALLALIDSCRQQRAPD